jgi:hypothetical protein
MPSRSARAFYSLDTLQQRLSIVDWLLQYAFGQCASDSPLEPRSEK